MGRAMDVEPAVRVGFVFADFVAHIVMKDFRSAAREAADAGFLQVGDDFAHRLACDAREPIDLDPGPGLEMQSRISFVQNANHMQVPVVFHFVMQAAHDVHLGGADLGGLLAPGKDLLVAHQVAARIFEIGAKGAEHAAIHAHVRGIQMRVDVVVGDAAVLALAHQVGQFAHGAERSLGPIEKQSVVERQPLAGFDFAANRFECWFRSANHDKFQIERAARIQTNPMCPARRAPGSPRR